MPTIYTIGHSTRSLNEFMNLLESVDIQTLADVRTAPGSRKYPHFNKVNLSNSLPKNDIHYIHLKKLGGWKKKKKGNKKTRWRNESFESYANYMDTEEFEQGIRELIEIAEDRRTTIMCAEAVWWRCHRGLIADYLKVNGWDVQHIMGKNNLKEHPYTSPARIVDGTVSYT